MQDRPDIHELLEAVRRFLEQDVVPELEGSKQFHARVAANVLAIVQRELAGEENHLRSEWARLAALLDLDPEMPGERALQRRQLRQRNELLCQRIRQGEADSGTWAEAVREHVQRTVEEKLSVTDPKLLAS